MRFIAVTVRQVRYTHSLFSMQTMIGGITRVRSFAHTSVVDRLTLDNAVVLVWTLSFPLPIYRKFNIFILSGGRYCFYHIYLNNIRVNDVCTNCRCQPVVASYTNLLFVLVSASTLETEDVKCERIKRSHFTIQKFQCNHNGMYELRYLWLTYDAHNWQKHLLDYVMSIR